MRKFEEKKCKKCKSLKARRKVREKFGGRERHRAREREGKNES